MLERNWVDFGQQERLTVRLKELIRNYPRGLGIIKEFVQNADDARARSLHVVLDLRVHPGGRLADERMKALLGPALLISNESMFSPKDFQSIQHIGESNKAESGPKTGRFGLGFNTCYNVTDYPSFISGDDIVCFDPHQNAIARPGGEPGIRGKLTDVWRTSPDWLTTFMVAGLGEFATHHSGTIFRLPLRTSSQAAASDISKEPFERGDFEEIVSQLKGAGAELLLFTKHLISITISEIDDSGRDAKTRLVVSTSNPEAVTASRDKVLAISDGGQLAELLVRWRENPRALPCATYAHDFEVAEDGEIATQSWLVTTGLFSDPEQKLLDTAQAMLAIGEKALPWAGAAAKLGSSKGVQTIEPISGRIYCGLPLSEETLLPVHVNGYFDLDSSRSTLSSDRNIVGANRTRVEWNEQLMQHGVAAAYAALLTELRDAGEGDALAFYDIFPDLKATKSQLLSTLGRSVYARIADGPTIRVCTSGGSEWLPLGKVWLAADRLKAPLIAEGRPIAEPSLPFHVRSGFEAVGQTLNNVTPKVLRDFLSTNQDVDVAPEDSDRPCLRNRLWVEDMLRFCLEDGSDTSLQGLPLAWLCDGRLHTFGHSKAGEMFSGSDEQRQIFATCPHWFIDPDFEKSVGLKEQRKSRFSVMTAAHVIANLSTILGKDAVNTVVDWEPEGTDAPNAEWLAITFRYFAKVPDSELMKSVTPLQSCPLLPDQGNRLHPLRSATAPIFRPNEPAFAKLITSLEILGIPLITGPNPVTESLREFAAAHPKCLDIELNGTRLVAALAARKDAIKEQSATHNAKVHDPLLTFLSDDRFVSTYIEPTVAQLRSLPLFPTTSGGIVVADGTDTFVSTNYTPPQCAPSVTLLKSGPEGRWKKLLHKLKVQRLDQQTLVEQVLLPKYGTMALEEQIAVLKWIRDHLTGEVARLDKTEAGSGQRLLERVRNAELVKCQDGKLYKGTELYDPREPVVQEVLGTRAAVPDLGLYSPADPAWLPFFELLGMERSPRAKDLLVYIDALVVQGKTNTEVVAERLMDVFDFLQKNWTRLATVPVFDGSAMIGFGVALKKRAWLPAQRSARYIEDYPGFLPQEDRFYSPSEIYPPSLINQIGGVLPVLAGLRDVEREVRLALGMPFRAPLDAVVKQFDRLIDLWHKPEYGRKKPERFETSVKDIYRYLGTIAGEADEPGRSELVGSLQQIRSRYKGTPCVWSPKTRTFWKPEDVYFEKVPFFEPRRTQVSYSEDRVNAGLTALGRRLFPAPADYLQFVLDLHAELGDDVPSSIEQSQVLHALRHIAEYGTSDNDESGLPLLARDGRLRLGKALLWEDTTRWREKIDLSLIPLVHEQVPTAVVAKCGVPRMSEHLYDELVSEPECSVGHGLERLCESATRTIHAFKFADALRRLIRHEFGPDATPDIESVARIRVVPAISIQLQTILNLNGSTTRLGEYAASSYFRDTDATLFVAGSSERQMLVALAKAVNALINPSLSDLAALQEILRATPDEIDGILYDYEIPTIEVPDESPAIFEEVSSTQESAFHEEDENQEETDYAEDHIQQSGPEGTLTGLDDSGSQIGEESREHARPGERVPTATRHAPGTGARAGVSPARHDGGLRPSREAEPRPAGGSDDHPPIIPGSGKSGWEGAIGAGQDGNPTIQRERARAAHDSPQRGRIVTYVEGTRSGTENHAQHQIEADEIGDAAVDHVFTIEERAGRQPVKMHHDNEGFDILSKELDGQPRYIEVKGIDGAWGESGVGVTRAQFVYAQKERKRFWLYVVENARSDSPTLHCINDPATQITQYRFDSGWKTLTENARVPTHSPSTPATGMKVSFVDSSGTTVSGTVINVEHSGVITRLSIRTDAGGEIKKFVDSSMRFSEPEAGGAINA